MILGLLWLLWRVPCGLLWLARALAFVLVWLRCTLGPWHRWGPRETLHLGCYRVRCSRCTVVHNRCGCTPY